MNTVAIHYFNGRDGVRLAYRELGQGRPLILFHGYMGNAQKAWVESGHAAKLAAQQHHVILPDLRGHGDSARPHEASAYPADVLADDGLALIEQLGIEEYDLGGYSLGARVTLRMLARRAAPRRAILGGQGLDVINRTSARTGRYRQLTVQGETSEGGSAEGAMPDWIRRSGIDMVAMGRILDTFVETPVEALRQVQAPVLVIRGSEDSERPHADQLAALFPQGRYLTVPGDHRTAFTNPQFIAAINEFLAEGL